MPILIFFTSLLFIFIESTVFSFPFIFIISSIIIIVYRNLKSCLYVLILSLFSDAARVINFGLTPIFVFITFFIILYYEKYFGENDIVAIIAILILSTLIYSFYLSFSIFNIVVFSVSLLVVWIFFVSISFIFKNQNKRII